MRTECHTVKLATTTVSTELPVLPWMLTTGGYLLHAQFSSLFRRKLYSEQAANQCFDQCRTEL